MDSAKKWHVYILRCADGTLYTGVTNDLRARVAAHNKGTASKYTRVRRPVEVVWTMTAKDRGAALSREYALKQKSRAEKMRMVIAWQTRSAARRQENAAKKNRRRSADGLTF